MPHDAASPSPVINSKPSNKQWLAWLIGGILFSAIGLAYFPLLRDGHVQHDPAPFELRAISLPVGRKVPAGEFFVDRVQRFPNGDLLFACRYRVKSKPALAGLGIPSKLSNFPAPALRDERGNQAEFRRDPDAIAELRPNLTIVRDYESDTEGFCEYVCECQFSPLPEGAKELRFIFPGHYFLRRPEGDKQMHAQDSFMVQVQIPANLVANRK